MDFFIFADGYLQEYETTFVYTVPNNLFHTQSFIEELKDHNDTYGLPLQEIQRGKDDTQFIYEKTAEYNLLDDVKQHSKPKHWKKKRDFIAYSIAYAVKQEAEKSLFVLPIPENFLVSDDTVQFIYKATKDMPITGFDPTQLFTHLKRLILYLYSKESFTALLEQKEAKTSDAFLVALANSGDYEELLSLIPYKPNFQEKQLKETTNKSALFSMSKKVNETKKSGTIHEPERVIEENKKSLKPEFREQTAKKVPKNPLMNSKSYLILGLLFVVSMFGNGYLAFEKMTYPSQVELLKKENRQLIEKVEVTEKKASKLEQTTEENEEKLKQGKKENEQLKEEIKENVKTIKELIDKNEQLKKSIKK
ncbi:hypothetical protein A5823_002841 [Enterococcus faecalis]|uniref:hypothetical protein n=1 Tax=Enterococcus faecalis TaxID=1351 RepID=UPI000A34C578|nr:hypothetical protein [Enterococcus faecalis]OTP25085.1 hypothetical protein A5823_002841 [Enterococcus faecalis]